MVLNIKIRLRTDLEAHQAESIRFAFENATVGCVDASRFFAQHCAGDRVGAKGRAALQALVVRQIVNLLELVEWAICGTLMVFEIELSTNGCSAACMARWARQEVRRR